MTSSGKSPTAVIFGCAGLELTGDERSFFAQSDPFGFILFARNCETPDQIRRLTEDLRDAIGRADAPILIDQEGGRVARLKPPHWRNAPSAARFGQLEAVKPGLGQKAAYLNARLLAAELMELGITVDCAPVLDLFLPQGHGIIGDRAFGDDPDLVSALGRKTCEGFLDGGVIPVIKHIPGHGRAPVDSHKSLPFVDTPRRELENSDFEPFRQLNDMPWAMTAHVVYRSIDENAPATTSQKVIDQIIRGDIGFDGLLLSDDLSMKALSGSLAQRAEAAFKGGCDVALHCNGEMNEMTALMEAAAPLSAAAQDRIGRGNDIKKEPQYIDITETLSTLNSLLEGF